MFRIFKKKEKDEFDYINFLTQIAMSDYRRHLLTEEELCKYFLDYIDREEYHVGLSSPIQYGSYIDNYNWEVYVYKKIKDDSGRLTEEYYSNNNVALVNSRYMNEHLLYKSLYDLRRKK